MTYDPNNIFAKILRGDAPAHIVDLDEHSLVMMDIMPQSPGHVLVIPKEPTEDIFSISKQALSHVILQTRRVACAIDKVFKPDGVMIMQLNRAGGGQTVFHLHFHVIPKWHVQEMGFHARQMEDSDVLAEHALKIRKALS